ncbi:SCO family protein [Sediminibacillus halophilus]|uniref:Protein SCO1/2 n=1 Tax=Sediminibacillus halophilus TaxID=482461 RepID=A0A1G9MYP6_9BACI|nr:SCO family protein [Sediminibacillus halophilus]SDL79349.1 protein SCO1/2 [Sediminibacillus halophilus]
MSIKRITLAAGLVSLLFLAACGPKYEGDFSYKVEPFSYKNQDGETVSKEELDGKFWVADMIFTNCETVCPPMTANMARLQDKLKQENLDVHLISFSIDPEHDSPEDLKKYSEERGGEFDNWDLLTGYEFSEIKEFSINSFKALVEELDDSDQYLHATSFYLVSPEGNAIKAYDGTKAAQMDKIVEDIKKMSN